MSPSNHHPATTERGGSATSWAAGLTREEADNAARHIVGWFAGADPDEFAKAVRSALAVVEVDRARRAERMSRRSYSVTDGLRDAEAIVPVEIGEPADDRGSSASSNVEEVDEATSTSTVDEESHIGPSYWTGWRDGADHLLARVAGPAERCGDRIRTRLAERGRRHVELAEHLHLDLAEFRARLDGRTVRFSGEQVGAAALFFGVRVDELVPRGESW